LNCARLDSFASGGRNLLDRLIVVVKNKNDAGLLRAIDAINSLSKSR
jgi:hypothetical protein